MLDLDSLAEKRAKSLNEQLELWHRAVWSPGFQKISSNMSDGEVEVLLSSCKSYAQVEAVVAFLATHAQASSPFATLSGAAKIAGLALGDWISSL